MTEAVTSFLYYGGQGAKACELAPHTQSPGCPRERGGLQGRIGRGEQFPPVPGVHPARPPSGQWKLGQDEAGRWGDPGSNTSSVPDWLCDLRQCTSLSGPQCSPL